jgi:hypothetical protein
MTTRAKLTGVERSPQAGSTVVHASGHRSPMEKEIDGLGLLRRADLLKLARTAGLELQGDERADRLRQLLAAVVKTKHREQQSKGVA